MLKPPDELLDGEHRASVRIADWIEISLLATDTPSIEQLVIADRFRDDVLVDDPPTVADLDGSETVGHEAYWSTADALASNAFRELRFRASWLGDRYPLTVADGVATYTGEKSSQIAFRFLTLARARHLYPSVARVRDPGEEFEDLATLAMGHYVGGRSIRFGTAGGVRGPGLELPFWGALDSLADLMNERRYPSERFQAEDDFLADVVSWRPFGDGLPGQSVVLCQATLSEDEWWLEKRVPAKRWARNRLIPFMEYPARAVAFVESLSATEPDLLHGHEGSLPVDRFRILSVLPSEGIDEALAERLRSWSRIAERALPR